MSGFSDITTRLLCEAKSQEEPDVVDLKPLEAALIRFNEVCEGFYADNQLAVF